MIKVGKMLLVVFALALATGSSASLAAGHGQPISPEVTPGSAARHHHRQHHHRRHHHRKGSKRVPNAASLKKESY